MYSFPNRHPITENLCFKYIFRDISHVNIDVIIFMTHFKSET